MGASRRLFEAGDFKHDAVGVGEGVAVRPGDADAYLVPRDGVEAFPAVDPGLRLQDLLPGCGGAGPRLFFCLRPQARLTQAAHAVMAPADTHVKHPAVGSTR